MNYIFNKVVQDFQTLIESASNATSYYFRVTGHVIRICCVDFLPSDILFSSIELLPKHSPVKKVCETFYYFSKDTEALRKFLPKQIAGSGERFVYNSEEGRFAGSVLHGFFSLYSSKKNETYIWLCNDKHSVESFISHPFHMELSWWAQRQNMTFLHSAAVGFGGKGVLLSGAGGSGKSTLSLSALLSGMDFLSDDYLLIEKKEKETIAIRLYTTGYMKEDILKALPEFRKDIIWFCREREKSLVSLDAFENKIIGSLSLQAVVIPHIVHATVPEIIKTADVRKLVPLLSSTSYQNRELKNKKVFLDMMQLLRNLPAYDFMLTDDIRRNAEFLKQWVKAL